MRKSPTDEELAELQDPDYWDWESAERHPPNPNARAVVRVHMSSADFREIMAGVRASGSTLEAFMREAALDRARACTKTRTDKSSAS
ncbi:MAG TPA: hypothetical protein VII06_41720 [Chloroflexota bacterium]|jgi:hypothetical protein